MIYTKKPNFFYIYFYLSKIKTKLIVAIKIDNFIYLCCKKYYLIRIISYLFYFMKNIKNNIILK